jgi:hypothetical protein
MLEMNWESFANTLRGKPPRRLEGSRFVIRQFCNVAASDSRERFVILQLHRSVPYPLPPEQRRFVKASRWDVTGSRLLPSDRTTALQSGSPPVGGRCDALFLTRATTN